MFGEIAANLVLDDALSVLDVLQTFFDLFLERRLEVELVHRVERHHWMKEMVCVEAFRADLLLAFETKQYVVLHMLPTFVGEIGEFSGRCHFLLANVDLGLAILVLRKELIPLDGFLDQGEVF